MDRLAAVGWTTLGVGLVGYATGVATAYPGRALSVTAVMAGITVLAIARDELEEGPA